MLSGGALALLAGVKIAIALARGRSNVGFLVLLALAFVVVTFVITHPRRTAAGSAVLADMTTLFSGLKDRASSLPRQTGNDVALLAAIYGVSAAYPVHPDMERLFPRPTSGGDSSSSSSSSSCGSSCGGGGCGGCGS